MTPTERLEAAAAKLERLADRQDQGRSVNPHEGQRSFLAQRAIQTRATAALLRAVTQNTRSCADGSCGPCRIFRAALTLAGSVGVSDD